MKRFLVLSCSVAISALFFHACSSSDDSMIDAPLTRACLLYTSDAADEL